MVWLNVVALSSMTALHDIPDSVFRNDGLWRQWYDAEAPETANVPDYEDRLSKFERMCVVKVNLTGQSAWLLFRLIFMLLPKQMGKGSEYWTG